MLSSNPSQVAVNASLESLLNGFAGDGNSVQQLAELKAIINAEQTDFLSRSKNLDKWIEANPAFEELADVLFDLLMVQFLSAELHEEDYFDSDEWNEIENKTLDKGSEMLNLFLYLSEAKETEVEVNLDDFLNEFLLVGEDEFQDEYRIYESLIVHEDLLDADIAGVRKIAQTVKPDTGLLEYFVPVVLFFQYAEEIADQEQLQNGLNNFEKSILNALIAFNLN